MITWYLLLILLSSSILIMSCGARNTDQYSILRKNMVKTQIVSRGVRDKRVLQAMKKVPRHLFIPDEFISEAYCDYPLPIGEGQTISQPYIVARMSELPELKGDEKVLEIGTGSGYQAAILSLLAREIYTIEIFESLAKNAEAKLNELGYKNVYARHGDGYLGWTEAQPFDIILITCAPHTLPESLVQQLKDDGRIVAPMGEEFETQILTVFEKKGGKLTKTEYEPVRFVPMKGKIEEHK